MSETPRKSGRLAVCAVLLLCAGAASWIYTSETGRLPWDGLLNTPTRSESSAPAENTVPSAEPERAVQSAKAEHSPQQISAALSSGPRKAMPTPEEALQARIDKAISGSGEAVEGGHAVSGTIAEAAPPAKEKREDPVVSGGFPRDLARWMAASYVPSQRDGEHGMTSATLRRANARYSTSALFRSVEKDPLKARASVLRYVYSPGMIEVLYRMYSPVFLDDVESAARQDRRSFSDEQVADLFAVYADMMERAAVSFDAASRVDIATLVKPVRRAAATEECANADFSKAYTALSEARAAGRTDIMAEQSDRMVQSARVASEFDAKEERARQALGVALKKKAAGPTLPADDLIFLAEWLGRRKASPEATASAASVFRRLAADMQARSVQLKARGASGAAGPLTQ
ncbi:MAG: hypothetical protein IJB29_06975 [Mailhella sp.]|nr:hypothetical protein [Mailhella sp.]